MISPSARASAASRTCAPSCRSRSMLRNRAADWSTARARRSCSSRARCAAAASCACASRSASSRAARVLQGRVVGHPVPVGDGVTEHPGREREAAEQSRRGQDRRRRVRPLRRAPPRDRDRRQQEARDQAEHGRAPRCVRGQRVEQDRQRDVGGGGLERRHRVSTVRLEAEEDLQRRDACARWRRPGTGYFRRGTNVAARARLTSLMAGSALTWPELARNTNAARASILPRVVPQPAPRAPHVIRVRAGAGGQTGALTATACVRRPCGAAGSRRRSARRACSPRTPPARPTSRTCAD